MILPSWIDNLLDIFFPPRCTLCRVRLEPGSSSFLLCSPCFAKINPVGWFCLRCQSNAVAGLPCSCKPVWRSLKRLYGLAWYDGEWRRLLHRFKYHGQPYLAGDIGRYLGMMLRKDVNWPKPDLVTGIPLHPLKQKERGYNQSFLLAKRVARELKVPFKPLLLRVKNTASQTSLKRRERRLNVNGAFVVTERYGEDVITGKSILIVDDIYTTGATLREGGGVLIDAGAKEINGAVAAIQSISNHIGYYC